MGYFANGSEGMDYEARYCDRCVHQHRAGPEGDCVVWLLHLLRNYDDSDKPVSVLHMLIPRSPAGGNLQCEMFVEKPAATREGQGWLW